MHDGVGIANQVVDQRRVSDVTLDERHASSTPVSVADTGVGQGVEHGHPMPGCSRTERWTKFAPMNPAPPVTSSRMVKP